MLCRNEIRCFQASEEVPLLRAEPAQRGAAGLGHARTDAALHAARVTLRGIWAYALSWIRTVADRRPKKLGFDIVVACLQRREFSLTTLGFGPRSARPTRALG